MSDKISSSSILQYMGFLHHHVPGQDKDFSLSFPLHVSQIAPFISSQLEKKLVLIP